jgi:hypothetical protein
LWLEKERMSLLAGRAAVLAIPTLRARGYFGDRREETAVPGVESRDFDSPDETRTPDKTQVDVVRMGVTTAARMTFEPGCQGRSKVDPFAPVEN